MPITESLAHAGVDGSGEPVRRCPAEAGFAHHFGAALPRGLREEAHGMSWDSFTATYGHSGGPLRLGDWACTDTDRRAGRLGPQARNFRAVIAVGDRITTSSAAAGGPVAALTAMLHELGFTVEILEFRQIQSSGRTATFIRGGNGARTEWAMGEASDPIQSSLRAVIACANRLASVA
ncbi:hypothetical protein BN971_04426 [Mycobacterium bohemicum DSM 44277]|uniref:2-isopropylmalate synthase LeuA allosteric (dimerisation) domain-containing protein n=1 Tax=Mycobacterium bohemicum DSM 44277 TaxID=1236609 RepID=A0A0U0WFZ2_MYCBE|nr:homocitrate synthase [Mycobacterium bohemicum]MCV6971064.1 homocitrate synthase [Mycobacterium bohemicum]CPR13119.1 hypothetical protein BN971_04426 [Mycobacterium bohemicum DSM 44277]